MNFDARRLHELLPAILRLRDQGNAVVTPGLLDPRERIEFVNLLAKEKADTLTPPEEARLAFLRQASLAGPMGNLVALLAEPIAVLQEDLDQLYDDQFIETCSDWVVAYIGDLVGYRGLHGKVPEVASPRADVARTIAYRRRKGTVPVLEQLAFDVTRWRAIAVEFFQRLIVTQHVNHVRLHCQAAPSLRRWRPLAEVGTAFDAIPRSIDVRRIASGRGRHNIPNVGLFLWRLDAYPLSHSPAVRVDDRRWRFHPLGIDQPLYTSPQTEDEITHLATPLNVPVPISRRVLDAQLRDYYTGAENVTKSVRLYENSSGAFKPVDRAAIRSCNLPDEGTGWAHLPGAGIFAIDPALGRIALPPDLAAGTAVRVDFNYAFSGDMGGGEYERASSFAAPEPSTRVVQVPNERPTIAAALTLLAGKGIVEITDSGRYEEALSIDVLAGASVELRAANRHRPTLVLTAPMTLRGGAGAAIRLDGLLIAGKPLQLPAAAGNDLRVLEIKHCTLVPGLTLASNGAPQTPDAVSLTADLPNLNVSIERSILGALRIGTSASVKATDSIIDATSTTRVAYAGLDGKGPGAPLTLDACTVIGKFNALTLPLVTNSIMVARLADGDGWASPVVAARQQEGCVRYSYVPESARVPRRYQCLPEAAPKPELATPRFTTLRYGAPAYAQLSVMAGARLLTGADDEGQPGAFHFLHQPQRETNLRMRLDEFLRAGLEAGIFYDS